MPVDLPPDGTPPDGTPADGTPAEVARYRAAHRAARPSGYSGGRHLAFTTGFGLAGVLLAASRVGGVRPLEWLTIPLAFLFANYAEYRAHRGPMHNAPRSPRSPLRLIYLRHAGQHHRFFTRAAMAIDSRDDLEIVLFPKALLAYFVGLQLLPIGLALRLLASSNVAFLFVATALGYYLCYEWLHLTWHAPRTSRVGQSRLVRALRRHHQIHHDPRLMQRFHFNITFPIFDRLLHTTRRGHR